MNPINTSLGYLKHRLKARKWDSFHSPFLFNLFIFCCNEKNDNGIFRPIEIQRKKFLQSQEIITRKDFGAGPLHSYLKHEQKIPDIARHALSLPFQCRFLSRLAQYTNAKIILELGTSLGISGAYLAGGRNEAMLITVEGDPALATKAKIMFDQLKLENVRIVQSTFEDYISTGPRDLTSIDLLFIDGNHRSHALISYFYALKHLYRPNTIIIVDDIYWSTDMQNGWRHLIALPEITQSVDCYHFGLLFFNPDFLTRENHIIKLPWTSLLR